MIARAVDKARPGNIVVEQEPADIGHDGFQFLAAVFVGVEIDTDDLEPLVAIGALNLLEPRDLGGARAGTSLPRRQPGPISPFARRG